MVMTAEMMETKDDDEDTDDYDDGNGNDEGDCVADSEWLVSARLDVMKSSCCVVQRAEKKNAKHKID